MSNASRLAVIIPVHGQLAMLEKCLESLRSVPSSVPFDIVLVDDGTPGGFGDIPSQHRVDRLIVRPSRGGFTAAVNDGLQAVSNDYDAFVLLNSDMEVLPGWLDSLVARWQSKEWVGIVGGMELSSEDPDQIICGGSRPVVSNGQLTNILELDRQGRLSAGDRQEPEQLEWVSFGVALIAGACYQSLGPLDPQFVNYFSDADYGLRANNEGFEVWYEPDCRVLHKGHATSNLYRARNILMLQADRERFCKKWFPSGFSLPRDERRWIRHVLSRQRAWRPRLIPHLDPSAPVSPEVRARLIPDPALEKDIESVLSCDYDARPSDDCLEAFRRLYMQGLAFLDIKKIEGSQGQQSAFLAGSPLEVLAPHPDDVAVSLGGLMLSRRYGIAPTRVHVLFGQSNYAVGALSGLGTATISLVRSLEEASYCASIGAPYTIERIPDRLLRRPGRTIYLESVKDLELDVVSAVLNRLRLILTSADPPILMAPLAAGLMADHAIVAAATALAVSEGRNAEGVLIYDDLPYVLGPGAIRSGLDLYKHFGLKLTPLTMDVSRWFEQKCELLSIYKSQLEDRHLAAVEQHGQALAKAHYGPNGEMWRRAERIWRVETIHG